MNDRESVQESCDKELMVAWMKWKIAERSKVGFEK